MGAEAITNGDDCASWEGAEALVQSAIDAFGRLDVLVNNAGILRDRRLVNMTEAEWDDVIRVHLKGHAAPLHFAARHWRRAIEGRRRGRPPRSSTRPRHRGSSATSVRPTTARRRPASARSPSSRPRSSPAYGVKVNGIAPAARTRLTEQTPGPR